jgi:hypothetical protein
MEFIGGRVTDKHTRMLIPRVSWPDEDGPSISVAMEDVGIEVFSICSQKKHGAKVMLIWIWIQHKNNQINGVRR